MIRRLEHRDIRALSYTALTRSLYGTLFYLGKCDATVKFTSMQTTDSYVYTA